MVVKYPALFHIAEERGFWISFPDIPECLTQGEDMMDAYKMAVEALGLALGERIKENDMPVATEINKLYHEEGVFPVIVSFECCNKPNKDTRKATIEANRIINDPNTKGHNDLKSLFKSLRYE